MVWPLVAVGGAVVLWLFAVALIRLGFRRKAAAPHSEYEGYWFAAAIVIVLGFGFGLGFGLTTGLGKVGCERYGRELGVNAHWELVGGCYIEVPGQDRLVPQSWIVPVIEGNRIRIDINAPGGAAPTTTLTDDTGDQLILIPNPNGDGSFIVVP